MSMSLSQYAAYLDTRRDLNWPGPPEIQRVKARPHLVPLPGVRVVLWNVYGTLLSISTGELLFTHPTAFVMETALDKTVSEFKMWQAMTRRPGQPGQYLAQLYEQALLEQRMAASGAGERHPEVTSEKLWESIIKKLFHKEYKFDTSFYGALNEFSRKVAYFFHISLQGTTCYPGAADALLRIKSLKLAQGVLSDGQSFTMAQLEHRLTTQIADISCDHLFDDQLIFLSCETRARKPSDRLMRAAQTALVAGDYAPEEVLHIGSSVTRDLVPARRLGFKTALFAADKNSFNATHEQLKDNASRPDVLLTELSQLAEVIS